MEVSTTNNMSVTLENTFAKSKQKSRLKPKKALLISIVVTVVTMIAEFVASRLTGSLMLWSDGLHMLSHAASLVVSYVAIILSTRKASDRFPFGWKRVEIIAAHINGVGLAVFTGFILYESIGRLIDPIAILSEEMMIVATIGLGVNLFTAFLLNKAGLEDLNTKSAFLHMLADTFSSVAILVGGVVILYTDWFFIDAILSIIIAIVIGKWAWGLLKESFLILINKTPQHISYPAVKSELCDEFPEIVSIVDVKVWEVSSKYYIATLQLEIDKLGSSAYFGLQQKIKSYLASHYGISEITIQMNQV